MFDRLTGLPSFHLFEDRLQTALTGELLKDIRMRRFQIAVIGVFVRDLPQTGDEAVQNRFCAGWRIFAAGVAEKLYGGARD